MTTRPTQLHDARPHLHTVLVPHDISNACLAERAPIARARGAV